MDLRKTIQGIIHSDNEFFSVMGKVGLRLYRFFFCKLLPAKMVIKRDFKKKLGYKPNLQTPQTLNEKLNWMKLYDRERWYTFYADKYAVRDFFKETFGEEHVIPLLFETKNVDEIRPENIKEFPCIIKANHSCGQWQIVRSPEDINWKKMRRDCRFWITENWYNCGKEYQYKHIERRIIVEKLLQTKAGKIPNDYKLHFINGELAFVYVSIDREGGNYRCIYDKDWNKLPFVWIEAWKYKEGLNVVDIPRPASLDKMIEMGTVIAKKFPRYIRVDYYDVDGHIYFGEITFHHGGGYDSFFPKEYDLYYGKKLVL